jgi:hypothetical protein
MCFKEMGYENVNRTYVVQDRVQWGALVDGIRVR